MTNNTNAAVPNPWLSRFAVFLAICTLLLLLSGAYITSSEEQAASTDPSILAGSGQAAILQAILTARNHVLLAGFVGTLTIVLAVWLLLAEKKWPLRSLAGCAIAIFALNGWVGTRGLPPLSPVVGVCHAILAHLFLSTIVMISVFSSPRWRRGPELVADLGHTSLRSLSLATPFAVLIQIALGASYRHNLTGVLPHMGGALVATILILIVCLIVTQDFGDNRSLHSAAVALLSSILTQITLGIATFTMKLLNFEDTIAFLLSSMLHVMVGSLTLAASVAMAMQVLRNVCKSETILEATDTVAPLKE